MSQQTVAVYDAEAATAECEGALWLRYGLESATPMSVGDENGGRRLVGLLLLGPKRSGRPLDGEDTELVQTLANQTAIAIESAVAFEQIRKLKEGLEEKVEARTLELREAQNRLVESEKEVLLGRLVAGVVHEINTPLGALRSSAQTVQRALSGAREMIEYGHGNEERLKKRLEAGEKLVATIDASSRRIDRLVQSLKGFANLDEAARRVVDLENNIDSVLGLMGPTLGDKVHVKRSLDTELRCECYPARFNQALANLLRNAVEAGASNLQIVGKKGEGELVIEVVDNGRGIEPERLQGIFNIGFAEKRSEGRMGLSMGLPYAKRTMEEVGGRLTLSSELGRGTAARIILPRWSKETAPAPRPGQVG